MTEKEQLILVLSALEIPFSTETGSVMIGGARLWFDDNGRFEHVIHAYTGDIERRVEQSEAEAVYDLNPPAKFIDLRGKKVAITGKLKKYTRISKVALMLASKGAIFSSSVTRYTDYLVVADSLGAGVSNPKIRAARRDGVPLITEYQLMAWLQSEAEAPGSRRFEKVSFSEGLGQGKTRERRRRT